MKRPLFKVLAFVAALVVGTWLHAAPPPNDNLADAQLLTGDSGELTVDTTEATREDAEDDLDYYYGYHNHTVWYKLTASKSGPVSFDTHGSDFDTMLEAYSDIDSGAIARSFDYYEDGTSRIEFIAQAGQTYLIRVGGSYDEFGQLALRCAFADVRE